ncbi:MAG: flagellar hook-length control protein FliK [Gammaproteobacteria bacterium]
MNILGANLRSLLSGPEGSEFLQGGLSVSGDAHSDFASSFIEQLGLLQKGQDNPDLAAMQQWVEAAKNGDMPANLQTFAAFLGNEKVSKGKISQDIDLEDTLQTLADVMQQLQQLESGGDTLPVMAAGNVDAGIQNLQPADSRPVDTDTQGTASELLIPLAAVQAPIENAAETTDQHQDLTSPLQGDPKVLSTANGGNRNLIHQMSPNTAGVDESGNEFNRNLASMLANGDTEGGGQRQNPNPDLRDSLLSQLEVAGDNKENGAKSLPAVAADIAKLNQFVRSDSVSLPNAHSTMNRPFGGLAWNQELGDKLIWMHKQAIPSAELRLNPAHLGPLQVKVDVSGDQATVTFTAHNLAVKEAIEAAIPKLREMLGGQQLNLADVNVSQQQADQRQSPREFFQMANGQSRNPSQDAEAQENGSGNETQELVDEIEAGRAVATNGLLSLFA